jgi:hypothetical protein
MAEAWGTVETALVCIVDEAVARALPIWPAVVPACAKPPWVKKTIFLEVYVRCGQAAIVDAARVMALGRVVAAPKLLQQSAFNVVYELQQTKFVALLTAVASCWVLVIKLVST